MLDKKKFYQKLKPFANKHLPINFFFRFGGHYEIVFNWQGEKPNGDFNPMMYAQLIDSNISGSKKYVVPDLIFDCQKEGATTDYKLFKFLDSWATKSVTKHEAALAAQEGEQRE